MSFTDQKLRGFDLELYIISNRDPDETGQCLNPSLLKEPEIDFGFVREDKRLVQQPKRFVATGPKADQLDNQIVLLPDQHIGPKEMAADIIRWQNLLAEEEYKTAS